MKTVKLKKYKKQRHYRKFINNHICFNKDILIEESYDKELFSELYNNLMYEYFKSLVGKSKPFKLYRKLVRFLNISQQTKKQQ